MATVAHVTHQGEHGLLLAAGELEAVVIPSAGMVVASLRLRGNELLGRANLLAAWVDGGHTMGIPLLHPWANRIDGTTYAVSGQTVEIDPSSPLLHRDGNGLPIHGLLGACRAWKDVESSADETRARVTALLDAADVEGMLEAFPFPHRLELSFELRPELLAISTTLTPTGDVAVPIAFGWHPYFQLADAERADWQLELPQMQMLELDELQLPTGGEHPFEELQEPLAQLQYDDAFAGVEPRAELSIGVAAQRVTVSFDEGYRFAQVFAPLDQDVVALEPMTAPANALVTGNGLALAAPGAPYRARFSVHVR